MPTRVERLKKKGAKIEKKIVKTKARVAKRAVKKAARIVKKIPADKNRLSMSQVAAKKKATKSKMKKGLVAPSAFGKKVSKVVKKSPLMRGSKTLKPVVKTGVRKVKR